QHATAGSTQISLLQSLNLQPGDELAIAPTDYYLAGNGSSVTQLLTVTSVNGSLVQFQQPLNAHRWGRLQYATTNGMSLDSVNIVPSPVPDTDNRRTPKVLDERAPVGKLTRNITIQAPNDALWQNQGFGAHIMIMGTGAEAHVSGIEIKRGGQRNRLGRYPFHWHMLSYVGSATLADATGQYFRNSSINQSTNRGIVIHGTNGVSVENNVVYNVLGHGIFTEDAVERRNIIDSNLVMLIRNTTPTNLPILKIHEGNTSDVFGSSGFWISNPDNTLTNNIAADCNGFGFWLAFTTQPWGESINVLHTDGLLLNPSRLQFGVFDNNTASSSRNRGVMLDLVENSNEGTVVDNQYWNTTNGRQPVWPNPTLRRFSLARVKVWKNGMSGIWDRAVWPDNFEIVSADNCGRFFAGSGDGGIIENSLVIGTSLNHLMNGTNRPLLDDAAGGNQT
ncbi:MAG: right-handed parallel beta-helix repeat-containing protein, partial [Chitinophagaceae bacterium]